LLYEYKLHHGDRKENHWTLVAQAIEGNLHIPISTAPAVGVKVQRAEDAIAWRRPLASL